jgi:hypothetical protein
MPEATPLSPELSRYVSALARLLVGAASGQPFSLAVDPDAAGLDLLGFM